MQSTEESRPSRHQSNKPKHRATRRCLALPPRNLASVTRSVAHDTRAAVRKSRSQRRSLRTPQTILLRLRSVPSGGRPSAQAARQATSAVNDCPLLFILDYQSNMRLSLPPCDPIPWPRSTAVICHERPMWLHLVRSVPYLCIRPMSLPLLLVSPTQNSSNPCNAIKVKVQQKKLVVEHRRSRCVPCHTTA